MKAAPLFDFLLHDVLGNLFATLLTAAAGYLLGRLKRRTHRPADRDRTP
ncbi:hypothetical protein ACFYPN_32410 [Streptomyces sp. NPDC005576]